MPKQAPGKQPTAIKPIPAAKHSKSYILIIIGFVAGIILTTFFFLFAVEGSKSRFAGKQPDIASVGNTINIKPLSPEILQTIKSDIDVFIKQSIDVGRIRNAAVYLKDINTGLAVTINPDMTFSPSSLMKVPIMMAVLKEVRDNRLLLKEKLLFSKSMEREVKGPQVVMVAPTLLQPGTEYTIEELIELMIGKSDNEATFMLLEWIGLDKVHALEEELGFTMPAVKNYYDDCTTIKQYTSFFSTLVENEFLGEEMSGMARDFLARADWNYGIRKAVPANIRVCHKYGLNSRPYKGIEERVDQIHHFAIVDLDGNPFILGIASLGDDELSMLLFIESAAAMVFRKITASIGYYSVNKKRPV